MQELSDKLECLLDLYQHMIMAREIDVLEEEFIHQGEAFFHVSGAGHEGTVALYPHLIRQDWLHCHYRDKALMAARGVTPDMFFFSLFCKKASHSCGRQMSAHMSDPAHNIMSIVGPVGNSALQAVGVASEIRNHSGSPLVLCSLGDGMSQQGEVLEAIAHAVRDQLPVLFLIHNNQYAISTLTRRRTFFSHPNRDPDSFYGIPITRINGRDVASAYNSLGEIVSCMRNDRKPAIIIFDVDRLSNHTNADDQRVYRAQEEIERICAQGDPIRILRKHLEMHGLRDEEFDHIHNHVQATIHEAARRAQESLDPQPTFTAKRELPPSLQNFQKEYRGDAREPRLTMLEAIRSVLELHISRDERVSLLGEDIEDPKGDVFGLTRGLTRKFPGRVTNSPLSESTIIGVSIGRALAGGRPVAFIQFADFLPLTYNQIFAEIGSMYWRSNGAWEVPMIVIVSCGAYRPGLGPFHSGSLESLAVHTPGIDVFMPSTASDAAGLLNAAFASKRPTLFFYPKNCLNKRDNTTSADVAQQFIPPGKARVIQDGTDITLVGWGNTVALCQQVAATLEYENAFAEIIDLRSLSPWDKSTIIKSAEKTRKLVVVHEDNRSCGLGAEIIATVTEHAQYPVQVRRVARPDTHIPCNFENQLKILPSFKRILDAAAELLNFEVTWMSSEKKGREDRIVTIEAIGSSPSDESVTIFELHVTPGSTVSIGDLVATLEADKAAIDLSSPVKGKIIDILVDIQEVVKIGSPIMTVQPELSVSSRKRRTREQMEIPVLKRKKGMSTEFFNNPSGLQLSKFSHQTVIGISSISTALGSRIITNEDIAEKIPMLTAQEILRLTGIEQRRWVGDHETAVTLGVNAARALLEKAGLMINEIDLLLCCTGTPLFITPSMACLVLNALSQNSHGEYVQAYDVNAACSGYLYALQVAYDYLKSCPNNKVLIVTTETLSCKVKRTDTATAPIFGDGASATLLYGKTHRERIRAQLYRPGVSAKGENGEALCVPTHAQDTHVTMNGRKVFSEAVRTMIMMLNRACAGSGIQPEELSMIIPHQANQRIIDAIRKRIQIPEEKIFSNIRQIGNTSSSSIPLCLEQLLQERTSGEWLGLCTFGGGFTFGGATLKII